MHGTPEKRWRALLSSDENRRIEQQRLDDRKSSEHATETAPRHAIFPDVCSLSSVNPSSAPIKSQPSSLSAECNAQSPKPNPLRSSSTTSSPHPFDISSFPFPRSPSFKLTAAFVRIVKEEEMGRRCAVIGLASTPPLLSLAGIWYDAAI
ncbi:hypothetical protein BHM03_00032306 [Ensete ventricosum]|nr:hypothetical protein BHM03_00032306 [Ensete ventricosum]